MQYTFDTNIFSDLHKDCFGMRPLASHPFYHPETTDDQRQKIWDGLLETLDVEIMHQEEENRLKSERFEGEIVTMMKHGAKDRDEAIMWIIDNLELEQNDLLYGGDGLVWDLKIPYSYRVEMNRIADLYCKRNGWL